MRFFAILLVSALACACSHTTSTVENYDGIPATTFNYRNATYRVSDVPASGKLLLSRSQEIRLTGEQHDIDAAVRTYFSEIGRSQCLISKIDERGTDQWEVKYSCQLR
jgi:hypothetical protein